MMTMDGQKTKKERENETVSEKIVIFA